MEPTQIELTGYHVFEKIYDSSKTVVYRGWRNFDRKPVAIKLLKRKYPLLSDLVLFRNQYAIAKQLKLPGIVQPYSLESYGNGFALVMEDFGGISLKEYAQVFSQERVTSAAGEPGIGPALPVGEFLNLAIQIARILEGLYAHRIIHKDIKPQNILIHPESKQVKLTDFSLSSCLPREQQSLQHPTILEGTLAYMSPEQTGRMNRGIDYRTDFYSLGASFYELLTGQLPFESSDPMELVHCHLARQPPPPNEANGSIPQPLSSLVMKLLSKTAEARYQSASGLRQDLEECQRQWQSQGAISPFELGSRDISDRFVIPEKLYGRQAEVARLLSAFARVAGVAETGRGAESAGEATAPPRELETGKNNAEKWEAASRDQQSELMLVAGFSGIGKTAVVNEVHKPIVRQRGYFIQGKFDQFKRTIPFSALVQAFQSLIVQLLTESPQQVQRWRSQILAALGESAQALVEVMPQLEQIIGQQPPLAALDAAAAQNRFKLLLGKFIRLFATAQHPLVLFLDDLQWADAASLQLLQWLMGESHTPHLLLIGAYRDNEVSAAHPLMLALSALETVGTRVNQLTLTPLPLAAVNQLVADSLHCSLERALPLSQLVYGKTQGNPFFINQFLQFLHQEGLIRYEGDSGGWQCDLSQVRLVAASEDVVAFMAAQLQKLPPTSQSALQLAACIGNQFDLATLAVVCESSPQTPQLAEAETAAALWPALQAGLVLPTSEVYKFFPSPIEEAIPSQDSLSQPLADASLPTQTSQVTTYKFLHDRVQQAAYSLIPAADKQATHLRIGRLLLHNTPAQMQEERIFELVNQFNLGRALLRVQSERDLVARLNLSAGSKAKAATAYRAALDYLSAGIALLSADSWQRCYDMTLALHEAAAEAAYLSGDFEQMEGLATTVLQRAQTLLEQVKVYEVKIESYTARNKLIDAVKIGLYFLQQLKIALPEQPTKVNILWGLLETKLALWGQRVEDAIELPTMRDPEKLAAMRILSAITPATYFAVPKLFPLLVFKQVNLSVRSGNSAFSSYAYAVYALILCGVVGEIDRGYQFGQLALRLLDQFDAADLKAKTLFLVNTFVRHWKDPLKDTLKPLLSAYSLGLETGDLEYAAYASGIYCYHLYFLGQEDDCEWWKMGD